MAKGSYTVGDSSPNSSRDASYKSCLCALLVFIGICCIILIAGIKWSNDKTEEEIKKEIELLGLKGDPSKTTRISTSITPPTTTKATSVATTLPSTIKTRTEASATEPLRKTKATIAAVATTESIHTTNLIAITGNSSSVATSTTAESFTTTTTTTTVSSTLTLQIIPDEKLPISTTSSSDIVGTQTQSIEQTTLSSQDAFNYTITAKTLKYIATSNPNENEIKKSSLNFTSTTQGTEPSSTTTTTTISPILIPQKIPDEERPITTTNFPDIIGTQTESIDQTTLSSQDAFNDTSTSKKLKYIATSNPNEHEIQKSPQNFTSTTTQGTESSSTTTTTSPILIPQIIPDEERPITTTNFPDIIGTQTKNIDQTTVLSQEEFNYTTTFKTLRYIATSHSNENEIQKSTLNSTSATTLDTEKSNTRSYEDLGNVNIITETSTETTGSSKRQSELLTAAVDYPETSTSFENVIFTKLTNETNQAAFTTEGASDYKILEVVEATNDYEASESSPSVTETDIPPILFIQNTTHKPPTILKNILTKIVYPITESTTKLLTTTEEIKLKVFDDGQKIADESDYYDDILHIPTTVRTQTTEKNEITDKMRLWAEKTSTTTNSLLLFRKREPVCSSAECKSAASRMLSLMDHHSVDPCDDFYKFACGGMQVDNADENTWKRLSEQLYLINSTAPSALRTFKNFYDSCVSHEYEFDYQKRIDGVLELVKEVGEILDADPPTGAIDMTELFAKLILRQSLPIMDIDIDIDKQTSNFALKLTPPRPTSILKESGRWSALTEAQKRCLDEQRHELEQLNLNLTKIYESYLTCQKNHAIYLNSIQTVVQALGFYSQGKYNQIQRIQDLRTTIEWDILDYLNTLPPPSVISKTILFKNYTVLKISNLQVLYPFLQWKELFNKLTGHELQNDTLVQVYFLEYFRKISESLLNLPKWKLNNILIAMYAQNLYENLVIPQAKHTREAYCLKLSSKLFPDIASNLYMKTWSTINIEESQKFITKIFEILRQNLTEVLQHTMWLDDKSRIPILLKLKKMKLTFNKQEDLYNDETYLNLKYNAVNLNPTDFQENAVKMLETHRSMQYSLEGKPYSIKYLWSYFLNAYDSEPASFYSEDLIMAPLGMVKQPVKGFPGYITMARIGLSLAREIGRHFDPVGIQYGMTLSQESKLSYEDLQTVMESESLFNVTNKIVGHQRATFAADATLSANERIADNTGLRLISDVFRSFGNQSLLPWVSTSFSREKVFFISVAQEYCQKVDMPEFMQQLFETEILPASLRVENIMTNSEHFSKAFDCPLGSAMNNNHLKVQFPHLQNTGEEEEGEEGENYDQDYGLTN